MRSNPKSGKIFTVCFGPASQSIRRGRVSREGALDHRESRERRDKIFAERQKTPKFSKIIGSGKQFSASNFDFHFFGGGKTNFFGGGITSKLASQ